MKKEKDLKKKAAKALTEKEIKDLHLFPIEDHIPDVSEGDDLRIYNNVPAKKDKK